MQQVVDLHSDKGFQALRIELLSISPDSLDAWRAGTKEFRITSPVLSDTGNRVAQAYGVMQWAMPTNEPGHTFVLVGQDGRISWIRDYGAPQNGGLMYVNPKDLVTELRRHL
jgi:peroxiredoxin